MTQQPQAGLPSATVLDLWEQGVNRHPLDRALLLLQYACPEESFESLCDWSVGARDARLLALRRATFGDRIESYAECPDCRSGLEFDLSCEGLLGSAATSSSIWPPWSRAVALGNCADPPAVTSPMLPPYRIWKRRAASSFRAACAVGRRCWTSRNGRTSCRKP
ncbi:MAG: hypothetical protein UZ03_NOB001000184 [Nitrospira sp. OLB3]|nr:MAG: hypothetical protein UZ03_NOB001000184 [Nitrospira sp. OLB3]